MLQAHLVYFLAQPESHFSKEPFFDRWYLLLGTYGSINYFAFLSDWWEVIIFICLLVVCVSCLLWTQSLFKTFVQLQSWIVVAESVWLTQPKIFTIKPFIGQVSATSRVMKTICWLPWVGFDCWFFSSMMVIFSLDAFEMPDNLWLGAKTPWRVWNSCSAVFSFFLENFLRFSPEMQSNYLELFWPIWGLF